MKAVNRIYDLCLTAWPPISAETEHHCAGRQIQSYDSKFKNMFRTTVIKHLSVFLLQLLKIHCSMSQITRTSMVLVSRTLLTLGSLLSAVFCSSHTEKRSVMFKFQSGQKISTLPVINDLSIHLHSHQQRRE